MEYKVVPLTDEHLDKLLAQTKLGIASASLRQAYFSEGSVAYCLLANEEPVFAGGIVNQMWQRGEAWMLPTPFFRKHVRDCYKHIKAMIPVMAKAGGFKREQCTCAVNVSTLLFKHLEFIYEGTMRHFGPNGEACFMYARLF